VPALSGVTRHFPYCQLLLACLIEFLLRAEATEYKVVSKQPIGALAIEFIPVRLSIWAVRTAYIDAFVPFETEPAQVIEELLFVFRPAALGVGILDAQNKRPAMMAGDKPIEKRRARITHVQESGGTGRESHPYLPAWDIRIHGIFLVTMVLEARRAGS
jgi:hypothetical protein